MEKFFNAHSFKRTCSMKLTEKDYTYKTYSVANGQNLYYSLDVLVKMAHSLEFAFSPPCVKIYKNKA